MSVNRPVWPGIFPGARLSRAHKAKIIEAFDTSGTVKEARFMGFGAAVVGVDIKTDKGEILMGADIHFVIEREDRSQQPITGGLTMTQEHIITARITVTADTKATAAAFDVPPQAELDDETEPTNEVRAARIAATLSTYKADHLGEAGPVCIDTVTDFMTDLRHFCEAHGLDLYASLDASYLLYCAEKQR